MKLGSHNTMTYLKPRKWWMWFGKFIAKCQKVDIRKQYDLGARWFDLRIAFPKDKSGHTNPVFSHGVMEYKGTTPEEVLAFLNGKNDAYCRIVLEKGGADELDLFRVYAAHWIHEYPNLKVTQIAKKGEWVALIQPTASTGMGSKDAYASANGNHPQYQNLPGILRYKSWSGLLIDDLYPWFYARFHNRKNIERYKGENIILLIDFVDIQPKAKKTK